MKKAIRVLYIDDSYMERQLVRSVLSREKDQFELIEAATLGEFNRLLLEDDYDLVLSDFHIAGAEGLEVLAIVQAKMPQVPVVFLTGTGSEEIAVETIKRGAIDYIVKSLEQIERLPTTIRTAIKQHRLEIERQQAEEALMESEAKFKAIFSESLDIIMIIDSYTGLILNVNNAVQRILGYDLEMLIGQHFSTIFPPSFTTLSRGEWIDKLRAVNATLEAQEFLRADGSTRPMDVTATLIPWGKQDVVLVTLRDMTDRLAAEEKIRRLNNELEQRVQKRTAQLARANEHLKELDHLKSKFITDMSHELRTPVANLSLYLNLIERGKPEKMGQYVSVLKEQVQRLEQLIIDIFNLSRLAKEMEQMEFNPVDLNDVANEVVNTYRPLATESNLLLRFVPTPDLPRVMGERYKLIQVVTNLLLNAINYTPEGSIIVRTEQDELAQMVILSVTDSGIGIAPEDQPHIFDRFYRGKHSQYVEVPGSGVGLGFVKEIVEFHGGQVGVESQPGEGSVFFIRLPVMTDMT